MAFSESLVLFIPLPSLFLCIVFSLLFLSKFPYFSIHCTCVLLSPFAELPPTWSLFTHLVSMVTLGYILTSKDTKQRCKYKSKHSGCHFGGLSYLTHYNTFQLQPFSCKFHMKLLKSARENSQVTYKGKPIRVTADLSMETFKARRIWNNILYCLKDNGRQPRQ